MLEFVLIFYFIAVQLLQDGRRDSATGARLCGAFTMLVLLGTPWMFSAFGAVEPGDNHTLTVFGEIFNVG